MKQVNTVGIVLRRTNYQEADRILTVLTKDQGKISMIAKGARRSKSKLAGGIELFAQNQLTILKGKSELYTLTSSRVKHSYHHIVKDLDRTMSAYEHLKIVNKITDEHSIDTDYFNLITGGLEGLNDPLLDINLANTWFYINLLNESGIIPDLRKDVNGENLEEQQRYEFLVSDMKFKKQANGSFGGDHIKLLRVALRYGSAKKLSKIYVDPAISASCSGLCMLLVEHNML